MTTMPTLFDSAPVDSTTASLLALIGADRIHARDCQTVIEGVLETCRMNDGLMDPNMLRAWLFDEETGQCIVHPPTIGATIAALRHAGVLEPVGYVPTERSLSRNNGRPARTYVLRHAP
jgi:hypothetical protein